MSNSIYRMSKFCYDLHNNFKRSPSSLQTVSIDDIDSVRKGRQSEGLNKHTEPSAEELCFSIIFKGRKKNLDLMAANGQEMKQWVNGLDKLIHNMRNLSHQQKSEQYPWQSLLAGNVFACTLLLRGDKCFL